MKRPGVRVRARARARVCVCERMPYFLVLHAPFSCCRPTPKQHFHSEYSHVIWLLGIRTNCQRMGARGCVLFRRAPPLYGVLSYVADTLP